jgi:hypothetical protein
MEQTILEQEDWARTAIEQTFENDTVAYSWRNITGRHADVGRESKRKSAAGFVRSEFVARHA